MRPPYPTKVVCNVLIQMSILFPVTKTPS
ncbi:protein of unknown function (plasmid) [Cupriavidus neocaledonicus]|uniref:Uncharacterized protein n=1 Tax=Cupriavidus neocaledonicus TaxID=1040979 RepID=A0A375HMS2_9BURK|nr:protein of unknown function [Cupriavidus neocaledonicus]